MSVIAACVHAGVLAVGLLVAGDILGYQLANTPLARSFHVVRGDRAAVNMETLTPGEVERVCAALPKHRSAEQQKQQKVKKIKWVSKRSRAFNKS